ncbi:MAG TPA: hypothetical protein VEM96_08625 [Pyrinomonadaceae bacterium]|nr:hypothetical protein [Pyrinomonadaceae bacterium]
MMILLHEQMENDEAEFLKGVIEGVYKIPVRVSDYNLDPFFEKISATGEFYCNDPNLNGQLAKQFQGKAVFLLTRRDIFVCNMLAPFSKADQWAFGGTSESGPYHTVSIGRLMGQTSTAASSLSIDRDRYLRRLELLAIHELGHNIVHNQGHYKKAHYVNATTGERVCLGRHCDVNTCVMYEVIELRTPPCDQEYLELDGERRCDAGLNEHLDRVNVDWFCVNCKDKLHLNIPPEYR